MATRGRETNRLYVDTAYDPDPETSHEAPGQAEPLEILRTAISTGGAEASAHEIREAEQATASARWRLDAQGHMMSPVGLGHTHPDTGPAVR